MPSAGAKAKPYRGFSKRPQRQGTEKKNLILKVEKQGTGMEALQRTDVGSMAPAWTWIP